MLKFAKNNNKMKWTNVHLRFAELIDGDLVLCRLTDEYETNQWNKINMSLAVYEDGLLYDAMCKEDNCMPREQYDITEFVEEYVKTGRNVVNIIADVL